MLNAYKYRLHPTREQSEFFNKSFGCVRFIYNWGLQKRIEAYAKDKGRISYVQLCAMLTELKKEEQYSWLREVSTECLQQALRNLDAAFKASEYDCCFVANMAYADFFPEPLRNEFDIAMYVKKYIDDPDGYDGIAFSRYLADLKRTGKYIDWEEMI